VDGHATFMYMLYEEATPPSESLYAKKEEYLNSVVKSIYSHHLYAQQYPPDVTDAINRIKETLKLGTASGVVPPFPNINRGADCYINSLLTFISSFIYNNVPVVLDHIFDDTVDINTVRYLDYVKRIYERTRKYNRTLYNEYHNKLVLSIASVFNADPEQAIMQDASEALGLISISKIFKGIDTKSNVKITMSDHHISNKTETSLAIILSSAETNNFEKMISGNNIVTNDDGTTTEYKYTHGELFVVQINRTRHSFENKTFKAFKDTREYKMPISYYENNDQYELISVAYHLGNEINSGHWVSLIKFDKQWYLVDDLFVSKISDIETYGDYLNFGALYAYKKVKTSTVSGGNVNSTEHRMKHVKPRISNERLGLMMGGGMIVQRFWMPIGLIICIFILLCIIQDIHTNRKKKPIPTLFATRYRPCDIITS
jgi:hypothetical protein